jgi:glutathione synthase/RimK-type ligase-like ATP-grasp enzyme
MPILFVSGVNDRSEIGVTLDEQSNPVYLLDGNTSVHRRLPLREEVTGSFLIFGRGVSQPPVEFKTAPSLIFNQIAEPDTHRGALERCIELCDQVNTTVINHPRHVLRTTRDQVAQILQGIPVVVVPRTQRFVPASPDEVFSRAHAESFDFPFIVRIAGEHGGRWMVRIDGPEDHARLHALPFDGRPFYLIEYIDCRDERGLYNKQRIAMIDGEPMLRHALNGRDWVVLGNDRRAMVEREGWEGLAALEAGLESELLPRVAAGCREIARRLRLEYFGIDGCMRPDGSLVVFEANANMKIVTGSNPERADRRERVYQKIYEMLTRYSGERVI